MKGGINKPGRSTGVRPGWDSNPDPVCNMHLKERDPQRSVELEGHLVFFCSQECKKQFESNVAEWSERLRAVGARA